MSSDPTAPRDVKHLSCWGKTITAIKPDNGNRSAVHWDMVLIQRPEWGGGEIRFDGELIRKDGMFVPKDLKPLNPENLK